MKNLRTYEAYRREKYKNKRLIVVDIQPTYRIHMNMDMTIFTRWLNRHDYFDTLYLYNGPDMGMEDEYEIKEWLLDYDLDSDIARDMLFFERGYAFFRDLMDDGVDDDNIVKIGKYLIDSRIQDIRELSEEQQEELSKLTGLDTHYLDGSYMFYIPELKDELVSFLRGSDKKPLCIGGGEYECYKEVILLLQMLDYEWDEESQFIY